MSDEYGERSDEPSPEQFDELKRDVLRLLESGRKIEAIKTYREQTGSGLADAKRAVEELGREHGLETASGARGCGTSAILLIAGLALLGARLLG